MNYLLKVGVLVAVSIGVVALPVGPPKPAAARLREPFSPQRHGGGAQSTLIQYHGGPILLSAVPIYVIYYGSFPATTVPILNDFFSNIGGSPQYNVNTTYFDGAGNHITDGLSFSTAGNTYFDAGSQGNSLSSHAIPKVIQNALQGGHLPTDSSGVYFLITGPDVKVAGFCSSYCAYHTRSTSIVTGQDIKYALVPDPGQKCSVCDGNVAIFNQNITPNGDQGADEMTDSIYHELSETVTDPDLNAWFTSNGAENGDLCNFNYGTTYDAKNGAVANAHLGKRDYLIQTIWENSGAGFCANTLP